MKHIPVLKNEVLETFRYLKDKDGYFVDATIGAGGHSLAIAKQIRNPKSDPSRMARAEAKIRIVGIDKDRDALDLAGENIEEAGLSKNFILIHDDFKNINQILINLCHSRPDLESTILDPRVKPEDDKAGDKDDKVEGRDDKLCDDLKISGALIDLGVSSMQLDDKERGFSFADLDAKLDMRMDRSQEFSTFDIVNYYPAEKLEKIFREFGEEKFSKKIAKNICRARKEEPIEKVGDLLQVLKDSIPSKIIATSKKHFATNVFRALRIEVNSELTKLNEALFDFIDVLEVGAKLAVISFHSTEDRIVKETFRKAENPCICPPLAPVCTCGKKPIVKIITRKPVIASEKELKENPRARSAKLRVIERLAP